MSNVNIAIVSGNLTRDPELRYSASGTGFCKFTVAVNDNWKGKDGDKREKVYFLDCVAFGKTGETIATHFKKGKKILIEGKITQDRFEDKETGKKRSSVSITVQTFHFMGDRPVSSVDGVGGTDQQKSEPTEPADGTPVEGDIPF